MEDSVRKEYFELLEFESVGADPGKLRECSSCAVWISKWLEKLGFTAQLLMPPVKDGKASPPVVFAVREGDESASSVLFYGHYDVQPADPESEWNMPPFKPVEKDGRIYCRGAQDDKGQFFAFLCGMRDWLEGESARPRPTVKILIEGQEESGSGALTELAPSIRRMIAADVMLVCDTAAAADLRPSIVAGLRGVSHFEISLSGAGRDLHSGEYGGAAPNAAQAICELLSTLHAPDGSIAVEGFKDGIEPPSAAERSLAEEFSPGEAELAADIGCEAAGGERGLSVAQRLSFEPTIEINGVHSGYGGPGSKTVIPCKAIAKISMRLVPGQSPARAFECVRKHLEERVPAGMKLEISGGANGAGGFRLPLDSPVFRLAKHVLDGMDARGAAFAWDGASIPVVSVLKDASGAAPLIVGWGQSEDRIHSPNESYSLAQFEKAREWARRMLAEL